MATRIATATRNAAAAAVGTLANTGSIQVYTGAQPATAETAVSGTLLGTLTLSASAFGSPATGVITAATITGDTSADATGTAGWFRVLNSSAGTVLDGSITASGGGGDMILSSVSIVAGGTIDITSWTITMPGA